MISEKYGINAFLRPDNSVGIRNHVLIIAADYISGTVASNVGRMVYGVKAILHPFGRVQFGKDLEMLFEVLSGCGSNPNVAAVVVVGADDVWSGKIADRIARTGKPVEAYGIAGRGDIKTLEIVVRKAKEFVQYASEVRRESLDLSGLVFSLKCGESDTTSGLAANPALGYVVDKLYDLGNTIIFGETVELTGAEDFIAERIVIPELREKFLRMYRDYVGVVESCGLDLLGSQPTEGNIRGGLSTIEEKALGNIQKIGTKPIKCVLDFFDHLPKSGGGQLCFLNSPASAELLTLEAAKGSVVNLFTTGQGSLLGNPIMPVVKITANPKTAKILEDHIDVDISDLLTLRVELREAGERIFKYLIRVLNGRLTANEVLMHEEFAPLKLHLPA
ncbi:MAG: UxaA family hydrolase [Sulfolobales archaeon]|nr:UxaA family hydrolase [Sulfolobales archaeon]